MTVCMDEHEHTNFHILLGPAVRLALSLPGLFHRLLFALLNYTLSPDTYFVSPLVLILLLSARGIFCEFSHASNASQDLCKAARLSVRILLVLEVVNASGLSITVDGSFGFCSRASWKGEKRLQVSFWHSLFWHQDKARSRLNCDSSGVL